MSYIPPVILDNISLNLIKDKQEEIAFLTGGLAYYSLAKVMKKDGLGSSNIQWNLYSSILGIGAGYIIWNEAITEKKVAGFMLALISLYLINS